VKKPVALQKPKMPESEPIVKSLPFKSPFIKKLPIDKTLLEQTNDRPLTQIQSMYTFNSKMYLYLYLLDTNLVEKIP
jgi:hypothetical protein